MNTILKDVAARVHKFWTFLSFTVDLGLTLNLQPDLNSVFVKKYIVLSPSLKIPKEYQVLDPDLGSVLVLKRHGFKIRSQSKTWLKVQSQIKTNTGVIYDEYSTQKLELFLDFSLVTI